MEDETKMLTKKKNGGPVLPSQASKSTCIVVEAEIHAPPRSTKLAPKLNQIEANKPSEGKEKRGPTEAKKNVEIGKVAQKNEDPIGKPPLLPSAQYGNDLYSLGRFVVHEIELSEDGQEKKLIVQPEFADYGEKKRICMLRDLW